MPFQIPNPRLLPWLLAGCILPLLFLFLLPAFGFGDTAAVTGFLILIFACHLFHGLFHRHPHS